MGTKALRRLLVGVLAVLVLGLSVRAFGERIASRAEDPPSSRAADLAQVRDALARDAVAKALAAHGLASGDVEQRLARLSDEDLHRLAGNLDQVQAAGNVPQYIWVLLAIFLAVSILAMIF